MTQPDFESYYRGGWASQGLDRIPWNIGEPQPPIAEVIAAGGITSPVLDAGCGVGETAMALAALGHEVVGVDMAPTAIDAARAAATGRGLTVTFEVADITTLTGYDGRFATVVDSTLFHSLPIDGREPYVRSIARASRPGAVLHVLVFDENLPPVNADAGPFGVSAEELRDIVGRFWEVDDVRPSFVHAYTPPDRPMAVTRDDKGRGVVPAYLLRAHLPA